MVVCDVERRTGLCDDGALLLRQEGDFFGKKEGNLEPRALNIYVALYKTVEDENIG